jgi:peroxiredoxin
MKKIVLFLLLPVAISAQTGFSIKGNINGLKDSTLVFVSSVSDGNSIAQDYAVKGSFSLTGKFQYESIYKIGFIGYKEELTVFIGNENLTVTGDAAAMKLLAVKGSKLNDDFVIYQKSIDAHKAHLEGLVKSINAEKPGVKRDSMISVYRNILINNLDKFIKEKPASPVAPFVLAGFNDLFESPADLESRYNKLLPAAQKGIYADFIQKKINDSKVGGIGSNAVDFTQNDTANHPVSLSSFRGKYVLVDFWASWCRPCRMENPNVVAAYQQFKDKNFTVLSVSLDQQKDNWLQAIAADKLEWTHVSDLKYWNNAVAQLYKIESIPQNILVDPNGKIVARNLHGDELAVKLKQLLN